MLRYEYWAGEAYLGSTIGLDLQFISANFDTLTEIRLFHE